MSLTKAGEVGLLMTLCTVFKVYKITVVFFTNATLPQVMTLLWLACSSRSTVPWMFYCFITTNPSKHNTKWKATDDALRSCQCYVAIRYTRVPTHESGQLFAFLLKVSTSVSAALVGWER